MMMKWCTGLLLLACFLGGVTMYYLAIDQLDCDMIFLGGDDD
ncbi:hypothetical protein [Yokenella regensburgei]|nr:hypothetical protein [Yokenella regensburgei]MDQ4431880.1 hypothetical protein [Yokenella regensburgei]